MLLSGPQSEMKEHRRGVGEHSVHLELLPNLLRMFVSLLKGESLAEL